MRVVGLTLKEETKQVLKNNKPKKIVDEVIEKPITETPIEETIEKEIVDEVIED